MAVWSELPNDICSFIGKKLDVEADRCGFRSVCRSWRCCIPPFPRPPWLVLSESQLEQQSSEKNDRIEGEEEEKMKVNTPPPPRGFVGIGDNGEKQVVYEINLPEAHQTRLVGSTGIWLITVDKSSMIRLLNPFSRVQIDLPQQSTFEFQIPQIVVSSTPSFINCVSKDYVVMAIHYYKRLLAIARPGDKSWITVKTPCHFFEDIIFYKEQFYAVNVHGAVVVCDIDQSDLHSPTASVCSETWKSTYHYRQKKYLVEWLAELLLVIKYVIDLDEDEEKEKRKELPLYGTEKFKVYKLDFINREWEEVTSLGEYCLFLGFNTSVSIFAPDYSKYLKKNCIYFTDDYTHGYLGTQTPGGLDMGVFDMEDKSIQPHYNGVSTCYYSPPLWIIPNPR
ncbi:hypothetical protein AQUCO_01000082v1 [Aquilegia coerulea]|uniref:KIB1-4 beta-propeller domain-containing protein n=1 Tax=Aquilegia coerulea TaxID=218851 RepID=A0A2G5E879_AQUCA|nr:hypothetical protein AQUCO_01000082v1 [Aquilegia coerulea]